MILREELIGGQRLLLGDCLAILPFIPAASVDCILTDPPYHTDNSFLLDRPGDKVLAAHEWEDGFAWVASAAQTLCDGGAAYVFTGDDHIGELLAAAKLAGLRKRTHLVWCKTNPRPALPRTRYRQGVELAYWFTKGEGSASYFGAETQEDCLSWMLLPVVMGNERSAHPTQKPLPLIMRWAANSLPEGGTALDPFMGNYILR